MNTYKGHCHCGAISFTFKYEAIKEGITCNCSICKRKGAIMSAFVLSPDEFDIKAESKNLGQYQFDTKIAKHYFCKTCGIYPFHQTMRKPGFYRVNLGCIDEVDTSTLKLDLFDGKNI